MYCQKLNIILSDPQLSINQIGRSEIAEFDNYMKYLISFEARTRINVFHAHKNTHLTLEALIIILAVGTRHALFTAHSYFTCPCGVRYRLIPNEKIECENDCDLTDDFIEDNSEIYFELNYEPQYCDFMENPIFNLNEKFKSALQYETPIIGDIKTVLSSEKCANSVSAEDELIKLVRGTTCMR